MAGDAKLRMDFTGDASGIVGSLREIENTNKRLYKQSQEQTKATKALDSGTRLWLREMKKGMLDLPFRTVMSGMRSLSGLARGFYRESLDAAREQQKAAKRLESNLSAANVPIKMGLKYLDQYTRKLQSATNIGDDVAQGIIGGFLPLLDGSAEKKLRQATKLTTLAADLAAMRGLGASEVGMMLQNVIGKMEYGELTRLGVNKTEADRARELDKAGGDGRQYILNSLMAKSSGAAAKERALDPNAALENEIGDLRENIGSVFTELRNAQLNKMLPFVEGINKALEGADLKATAGNLVDAFSSGKLLEAFRPSWNLMKEMGGTLVSALGDILEGSWEALKEILRVGALQFEHSLVMATNDLPFVRDRQSSMQTSGAGLDYLNGQIRTSLVRESQQGNVVAKEYLKRLADARKSGEDPADIYQDLIDHHGSERERRTYNATYRSSGRFDLRSAKAKAGSARDKIGKAVSMSGDIAPRLLEDAQGAIEESVVKKSGASSEPGGMVFAQRLAYILPGVRL